MSRTLRFTAIAVVALGSATGEVLAAGLNTDVALTPDTGGTILRIQWRRLELDGGPDRMARDGTTHLMPVTLVHGVQQDLAVLATFPMIHRTLRMPGQDARDSGLADVTLLAKYRFFQEDAPGTTTRWALLGGVEIPTYNEPFSSESLDGIAGMVWTFQEREMQFDWDLLWKFNTGGGPEGEDELRADAAYSHRLFGGHDAALGEWALYAVAELNAHYWTDGSRRLFGSPGLQLTTEGWILEAGVQLPVHQEMAPPRLESDWTAVLSVRVHF